MIGMRLLAGAVVAAGIGIASPGLAAPGAALAPDASLVQTVTFWGHPYPYGYAYRHDPCVRRVRVETPRGLRWKWVRVCR
jgi:ABC-type glycerol-3-phosphate transport system substrate-binding protein